MKSVFQALGGKEGAGVDGSVRCVSGPASRLVWLPVGLGFGAHTCTRTETS